MPLRPGAVLPKDMTVRDHALWCREQNTAEPEDISTAIAAHTASNDNTTAAELAAAITAHTNSTDNTTQAELDAAFAAHAVAVDPHPVYTTAAEVASAITTHEGASNPHPTYLTQAEGDAIYVPLNGNVGFFGTSPTTRPNVTYNVTIAVSHAQGTVAFGFESSDQFVSAMGALKDIQHVLTRFGLWE